jgi:tetratricopeptide (TPR) repeat protein
LLPEVKAKLLRFEAGIVLQTTGDIPQAKNLLDEAHALSPSDRESFLQALIAYTETGPEAAFPYLDEQHDLDQRNFKAACYLEIGRLDEARALLNFEVADFEPNAETFRLRAFVKLLERDTTLAQLEIRKTVELAPQWASVRYTEAVVNYYSALSPAALPDFPLPWPEPVEWYLIKRDDESLQRLRLAGTSFEAMLEKEDNRVEERQRLQTWRLACLANDPGQQVAAIQYCQEMLVADAVDFRAVSWAVARNFDLDLSDSETALAKRVKDGRVTIPHVLALVGCYIQSEKLDLALSLLDDQRDRFEKAKALSLWDLWYVQLLVADGKCEQASEYLDQIGKEGNARLAQLVVLNAEAKRSGNWQPSLDFLDASYEETRNPRFLMEACELAGRMDHWDYAADRAEALVEVIRTEQALRSAAYATYNVRRYTTCLDLLDRYAPLCKDESLPQDLRRIRAICLQEIGVLPSALTELESLVHTMPTIENLLTLAQLYSGMGDLKSLVGIGRIISEKPDLDAGTALQIAQFIQLEDPDLARELWFRAVENLPDEFVGQAMSLGYRLDLDEETSCRLMSRMVALGQQGQSGVYLKRIEDLVAMASDWHKHRAELERFYLEGRTPIHLVVEQLHTPLVYLYRYQLMENAKEPDFLRNPSLLVRHGARSLVSGFPDNVPAWRLHLDITSLLLAAHLEILDEIERVFTPLRIPSELIGALVEMRSNIQHTQPSRLQAYQQLVELADAGAFETIADAKDPIDFEVPDEVAVLDDDWRYLFDRARAKAGYQVDFLPLRKPGTSEILSDLPEVVKERVIDCQSILKALEVYGPLTPQAYVQASEKVSGGGPTGLSQSMPEPGASLFFYANTPDLLIGAGLFRDVCMRFHVYVQQRQLDQARGALKAHRQTQSLDRWLESLIARLRTGLETGRYEAMPRFDTQGHDGDLSTIVDPTTLCLLSLLAANAQAWDVAWIDDRFTNSFARIGAMPIIDIHQILKVLVSSGALSREDYYEKLDRLRAANVRFIPVQKDEVLYRLQQARVDDSGLIETRPLEHLRRYIAATLYQGDLLQQPSESGNTLTAQGEVAFPLSLHSVSTSSLWELWRRDMKREARRARADWVLTHVYVDYLGLRTLSRLTSLDRSKQRYVFAMSLAQMLLEPFLLTWNDDEGRSARRRYFDWLYERILRKRFDADPQLKTTVTDILKNAMQFQIKDEHQNEIAAGILQPFYEDLPEEIREELLMDAGFMARIGIEVEKVFRYGDLHFTAKDFWQAATVAINGQETVIEPIGISQEIMFKPISDADECGSFYFQHPTSGEIVTVNDREFQILCSSPAEREAVLTKNRHWFDCAEPDFRQAVASIASTRDPQQRFDELNTWRSTSLSFYYEKLHHELSQNTEFQFSHLVPPSADGLLRHYRLEAHYSPGDPFEDIFEAAAQQIIDEESLPVAIDRLSSFPVPLPNSIIDAVDRLSTEEKRILVKQLLSITGSPISRFHLISLLLHFDKERPAFQSLARRIARSLFGIEGKLDIAAFLAVLKWTYGSFYRWSGAEDWSAQVQLALCWAHAHRLYSIFLSVGIGLDWLHDTFTLATQTGLAVEIFERNTDLWFDVTHPRHISYITLLFDGLCYSLGGRVQEFEDIEHLLAAESLVESDEGLLPVPYLLRDLSRAKNSLGSFLNGYCRKEMPLLITESGNRLSAAEPLENRIAQAINTLTESPDVISAWFVLSAVLGDLPPSSDLMSQLRILFKEADYLALSQKDIQVGFLAIHTAAAQCGNLVDEGLRRHLKDQLLEIVKYLSASETAVNTLREAHNQECVHQMLIEAALNIALAADSLLEPVEGFSHLLLQIVKSWEAMIPMCRIMVQRLIEDLPISQLNELWRLLAWLRAN